MRKFVRAAVVSAVTAAVALSGANPSEAATRRSAPAFVPALAPASCDTAGSQAAADAYLDALVTHDASAVPFAPGARRVENGLVTGTSGDQIRNDLNTSVKYRIITGLRDRAYTETGPSADGTVTVNVSYRLDVGLLSATLLTVGVKERFDVTCGQIGYIEATIGLP